MTRIPLAPHGRQAVALVDAVDVPLISGKRWHLHLANGKAYARGAGGRKGKHVYMHRVLLGLTDKTLEADHINGDGLDNRRENLRVVTRAQQLQNVAARGGSSRFRGVSWSQAAGKWAARASVGGKGHYLGVFADEVQAAQTAEAFRQRHMPFAVPDPELEKAA